MTCTDPILSQAIAKGPFADNYVHRHLREFISAEAGGNDGLGFSFLLLAVSLLRYAETPDNAVSLDEFDLARGIPDNLGTGNAGRFGGGTGEALKHWVVEGVLYMVVLGAAYGVIVGTVCRKVLSVALRRLVYESNLWHDTAMLMLDRRWVDNESFAIVPVAIGVRYLNPTDRRSILKATDVHRRHMRLFWF